MNNARSPADGFTLIEVVIALGICGLTIAVLTPIFLTNLSRTRSADARLSELVTGRSLLAGLPSHLEMHQGTFVGTLNGVNWQMQISPRASVDEGTRPGEWRLFRVSLDMTIPGGPSSHLELMRLGKRAPL